MATVVRFSEEEGIPDVYVEVEPDSPGLERITRGGKGIVDAGGTIEEALGSVRPVLESLTKTLTDLAPQSWAVEFGIKLNAETGVVVAKSALEGHFVVKLNWGPAEK